MIKIRKGIMPAVILALIVIAGSSVMRAGWGDSADGVECITGVINEEEDRKSVV